MASTYYNISMRNASKNKNNDLISIGMPVHNGDKYLAKSIKSILQQSYKNIELFIADDASSDESQIICNSYAKNDKRIKFFIHKKNIGSIANFNYVLSNAKGEYFMWAAQDDLRIQDALKQLVLLLKKYPSASVAVSNYRNLSAEDKTYVVYPNIFYNNRCSQLQSILSFLETNNLSYFYGLWRTKVLKKINGYHIDSRPIFKSSDVVTIFRGLLEGKFVYTSQVLFYKRDTGLYTNRYKMINQFSNSSIVRKKVLQYVLFPLFYVYDVLFEQYYNITSNFSLQEKILISIHLVVRYLKNNVMFLKDLGIGFLSILQNFNSIMSHENTRVS